MHIPPTPDMHAGESEGVLEKGYGPTDKHRLGRQSLFVGKAVDDMCDPASKQRMMEALRIERITGYSATLRLPIPLHAVVHLCAWQ